MEVWMTWCRRNTRCAYCSEDILEGRPVIKCRTRSTEGNSKWAKTISFHKDCWVRQAENYLEAHPYEPRRSTGRPRLDLSPEVKTLRLRLIRAHASLVHRQKLAATDGNALRVMDFELRKREIQDKVRQLGPVPRGKHWPSEDQHGNSQ